MEEPDLVNNKIDMSFLNMLAHKAVDSAIESVHKNGKDVPVGASVGLGNEFITANYAQDCLLRNPLGHAEYMAIQKSQVLQPDLLPDTIVVTLEPCRSCQDYIASIPSIKTVAYLIPLSETIERGISKPKAETINDRANRNELPFNVIKINNISLENTVRRLLDITKRDLDSGEVYLDSDLI